MASLHSAARSLSRSLSCELSVPNAARERRDGKLRPSSVVTCLASDRRRQDLNGETVAVVGLGASPRAAVKLAWLAAQMRWLWIRIPLACHLRDARRAIVVVPTTGVEARLYLSGLRAVRAHNAHNAGTAALLALSLDGGLQSEDIHAALPLFKTPAHRMEIVNDSKATNVDATNMGLRGIVGKEVVVMLGGLAKAGAGGSGLGLDLLVEVLQSHRAVILFGASGLAIEEELRSAGLDIPCQCTEHLAEAVNLARSFAQPVDADVLSPGCASFDEFKNFKRRGQVFANLAILIST